MSVLLHALLFFWLGWRISANKPPASGVVTVSLIEAVSHPPRGEAPVEFKKPSPAVHRPIFKMKPPVPAVLPVPSPSAPTVPSQEVTTVNADSAQGSGSGQTTLLGSYIAQVMQLVVANKKYPRDALLREEHGHVTVGVTIQRDGSIQSRAIESSSQFSSLDEAALEAVILVRRFPAIPAGVPAPLHLDIPIEFQIKRHL